jgi:hypothetical protein
LLLTFAGYWYYEVYIPARYLFAAAPLLLILMARGLMLLWQRERGGAWVGGLVLLNVVFAAAVSLPAHYSRYTDRFGDVEDILPRVVRDQGLGRAVVLMDALNRADLDEDGHNDYYATGFLRNDLDLRGDVVYARNAREQNWRIQEQHGDREVYLYRYLRDRDRAYLYQIEFAGKGFRVRPVPRRSPWLDLAPRVLDYVPGPSH